MTQRRCLQCNRRADKNVLCERHTMVEQHHMLGYPEVELDLDRVPYVRKRNRQATGMLALDIEPLPVHDIEPPCSRLDPELYFIETGNMSSLERDMLHKTCLACPILEICRESAISIQAYGFQGGTTPTLRKAIRQLRGQQVTTLTFYAAYNQQTEAAG